MIYMHSGRIIIFFALMILTLYSCQHIIRMVDVSDYKDYQCVLNRGSIIHNSDSLTLTYGFIFSEKYNKQDTLNNRQLNNLSANIEVVVLVPGIDSLSYFVENLNHEQLSEIYWGAYLLDSESSIGATGMNDDKFDPVYFEVLLRFTKADSLINEYRFVTDKDIYCDYHNCDAQEKGK